MKRKISVTVEETTAQKLLEAISKTRLKNKSQIVEHALKRILEEAEA